MNEHPWDMNEQGRAANGEPVTLDRRCYFQLQVFRSATAPADLIAALDATTWTGALYRDWHDPAGVGLVLAHTSPAFFAEKWPAWYAQSPFSALQLQTALTMAGRTYAIGYETDLEHVLLRKPVERLCHPDWPWAIWYPLRRTGAFARLDTNEQKAILGEHGRLGAGFHDAGWGADIRLACHGLDRHDNDFMVGLVGPQLHALSRMVQAMRGTRQTSEFIEQLGPFFVGHRLWSRMGAGYL